MVEEVKEVSEKETDIPIEPSNVTLFINFDKEGTPTFGFNGAWNVQKLGRVRRLLFRAYKHYMREIRLKLDEELKGVTNER